MKIKNSSVTAQILILTLAAIVLLVMVQAARAETTTTPVVAQAGSNQSSYESGSSQIQFLQTKLPQKGLGQRLLENTSLTYYHQFLGPTADGNLKNTYNVFQEANNSPGSGKAPLQYFHSLNLRHQINTDWSVGATLSAVNGFSEEVENKNSQNFTFDNGAATDYFNARAYVSIPAMKTMLGTFFTTVYYEHPTSNTSKNDNMRWGWVIAETFAFKLPDIKWSAGISGQLYRIYYKENRIHPKCDPGFICTPIDLQTTIVSGGPYLNYRFNDFWMLGSSLTFDWDQKGHQTGKYEFNNNLSDRGRVTLSYFPNKLKYLQSVGLFAQALLKFRPGTTALGADFSLKF